MPKSTRVYLHHVIYISFTWPEINRLQRRN